MALYKTPAVERPTTEQMKAVAESLRLHISPDDLEQYKAEVSHLLDAYDKVDAMVEPLLPDSDKYPTTPGFVPPPESNPYNAWARITNTVGSAKGKLAGKTIALKDNIHLTGVPLLCGSHFLRGFVSSYNATVVTRILDAGGIIKGKATCENMVLSGSSYTAVPGPVMNPFDKSRSAGGSTNGCAVLLATGEVDMAVGTDQGGSTRLPSCWCGTVGLKPTYGLVPYTGILPLDGNIDHAGSMARTVYDCALLLEVMAGTDGVDPRQPASVTVPNYTEHLTGDVSGLRVGLLKEGFEGAEKDVADIVKNAAYSLKQLGVSVDEFSFPQHNDARNLGIVFAFEGTYDTYMNGGITPLNSKGFKDTVSHDFMFSALRSNPHTLPVTIKFLLMFSEYVRENYGCRFYAKAVNVMRDIRATYDELFKRYDIIIMPTIKYKPPPLPNKDVTLKELLSEKARNTTNTFPYNALGCPALSINAGFTETEPRLPVGMMMVGQHFNDVTVLRLAHAFERLRNADDVTKYAQVEADLRSRMQHAKL